MSEPTAETIPVSEREQRTNAAALLGAKGGRNGTGDSKRKGQLASAAARKANRLARLGLK